MSELASGPLTMTILLIAEVFFNVFKYLWCQSFILLMEKHLFVPLRTVYNRFLRVVSLRRHFKTFIVGFLQLICLTWLKSWRKHVILSKDLSLFPHPEQLERSITHWFLILNGIQRNSWSRPEGRVFLFPLCFCRRRFVAHLSDLLPTQTHRLIWLPVGTPHNNWPCFSFFLCLLTAL